VFGPSECILVVGVWWWWGCGERVGLLAVGWGFTRWVAFFVRRYNIM